MDRVSLLSLGLIQPVEVGISSSSPAMGLRATLSCGCDSDLAQPARDRACRQRRLRPSPPALIGISIWRGQKQVCTRIRHKAPCYGTPEHRATRIRLTSRVSDATRCPQPRAHARPPSVPWRRRRFCLQRSELEETVRLICLLGAP